MTLGNQGALPVADPIHPAPDDSESSVVTDDNKPRAPGPGAAVDDQSRAQREVEVAAEPATASKLPAAATDPSQATPRAGPTAGSASPLTMLADVPLADRATDRLDFW